MLTFVTGWGAVRRIQITRTDDAVVLYTPRNAHSHMERAVIEEHWPSDDEHFSPADAAQWKRAIIVTLTLRTDCPNDLYYRHAPQRDVRKPCDMLAEVDRSLASRKWVFLFSGQPLPGHDQCFRGLFSQ